MQIINIIVHLVELLLEQVIGQYYRPNYSEYSYEIKSLTSQIMLVMFLTYFTNRGIKNRQIQPHQT